MLSTQTRTREFDTAAVDVAEDAFRLTGVCSV